ncbi:phage major capsid protein [Clostridium tetani]|uniref:phage major capsid protein n=1 Tax=Clostridium tetani TaxID=1513 RepID=UPI0029541EA7|nr:phage major capsid protein [Clostridium tetani]BDR84883.1 phage capsid protein [Clostridium tetani]
MSKELRELLNQLDQKNTAMGELLNKEGVTTEELKNISNEIDVLQAKIEAQKKKDNIDNSFNEPVGTPINNPIDNDSKATVTSAFINAMKSVGGYAKLTSEENELLNATKMTEGVPEDGGLTVPQDIRTKIKELRRSYPDALENYVHVESVTTLSGSRVIEKESDYIPFDNVDEASDFPELESPTFEQIKYEVKKKGGILKFSRELLQDSAENITGYIKRWVGKKEKVTRNALILKTLDDVFGTSKISVKNLDDLKDIFNVELDPAFELTSIVIMNQDVFNYLDKMKDKNDKYILQPDPSKSTQRLLFGKYPIIKVSNKTLKTVKNKAPIYCGDLKEAITIFDRESLTIEFNDKSDDTWKSDLTAMKVRERLDIKAIDKKAVVVGEVDLTVPVTKTE